ncbi:MAG: FliG C-terminal domain-containing protein [Spirochaetota bacterium]
MYPAILARKWTEYRYKERFIPAVRYDNVLPVHISGGFVHLVNREAEFTLSSADKEYRNLELLVIDREGRRAHATMLPRLSPGKPGKVACRVSTPGLHHLALKQGEDTFAGPPVLFYRRMLPPARGVGSGQYRTPFVSQGNRHTAARGSSPENPVLFCPRCRTRVHPVTPGMMRCYLHKTYIPIKDYLYTGGLDYDHIVRYITGMDHPADFRSGLVHLLNMIRLATLSDEMTIMTNLFKDDPAFAHYVTDRLFLFRMIPIMEDRELQRVLSTLDDQVLSRALKNETRPLVEKVLRNVSRRRAAAIRGEPAGRTASGASERAKQEVHRAIRLHFEQRFGRELRIPCGERPVYRPPTPGERPVLVPRHTGELLWFDGTDARPAGSEEHGDAGPASSPGCLPFDREMWGARVFVPSGITESTIYLTCATGIRYALVHQYDWLSSLEDREELENLPRTTMVPLKRLSSSVVLTVGAIDGKGHPREQLLRLSTGSREKTGRANGVQRSRKNRVGRRA